MAVPRSCGADVGAAAQATAGAQVGIVDQTVDWCTMEATATHVSMSGGGGSPRA